MELAPEIVHVARVEWPTAELRDDREEVVKRSRWLKRGGVRGSDPAPCSCEEESVLDDREWYSASAQVLGEAPISWTSSS